MATTKKLIVGDSSDTIHAVNCTTITIHNNGTSKVFIDFDTVIDSDSYCLCEDKTIQLDCSITALYLKSIAGNNDVFLIYG